MGMARRDRWRELLAPWLDTLVSKYTSIGRLHHSVTDEGDSCVDAQGVLWFRWTPARDTLAHQLELLSLMALLCETDARAFESLLLSLGDEYTQYVVTKRSPYEPHYTMGVYLQIDDDKTHTAVVEAGLLNRDCKVSETYRAVRKQLVEGHDMRGLVPLWIQFESRAVLPKTAMASTLALVMQLDIHQDNSVIGSAFRVRTLQLDVYDGQRLGIDSMKQLTQILDAGVRMPFFQCGTPFNTVRTADVVTQTMHTLHALLGPPCAGESSDTTTHPSRLEQLEVTIPLPASLAVPVCTAIAHSETLQCLKLDHNMGRRVGHEQLPLARSWQWLVYAIFSRDATHKIQRLDVTAEVLVDFTVGILRNVLALDDPLLALMDPHSRIESPLKNVFVSIPMGTEISLVYDYTRTRKDIAWLTTPHAWTALRVLEANDGHGYLRFVLPGWGECRVKRDAVSIQQRPEEVPDHLPAELLSRSIPHLRIDYIGPDNIDSVCSFLDVVGHGVRRLDLHEIFSVGDTATHIVSLIRRCPGLEMLDLFAVTMQTIQPLVDAFVQGGCSLQRLKLRQLVVRDMASMHAFFDTLADPTHAMTLCLRELSFHVFERTIQDASRGSILVSCAKMLAANTTLRVCRAITLSKNRCMQVATAFHQFDRQPLPARKGPLALSSKLAFLSVVVPSATRGGNSRARDHIDTNVVQSIFKFAADNEIRQSVVEVPVRKW